MPPKASRRVTEVVVLTTAMLTFISFTRAAAIVLCDMASTAWYIGGIVEQAIGKAAPWYILAVMLFSSCVLAIYVEASSMYVRGGVYKVVKEAMGGTLAKISVSSLMFDYTLTGPISSVSAGQYLAGLLNTAFPYLHIGWRVEPAAFSVVFAISATLYFWRQNIRGIEESSEKALGIMKLVAVMGVVLIAWCSYTVYARGFTLPPFELSFSPHALGWLEHTDWWKTLGGLGVMIAVGHAFLGMSGAESLAQVYREMEAPKLRNLKRAALVIFVVSLVLTTSVSFFSVSIIPDAVRDQYKDNLIAGLAMSVVGSHAARLVFQAFVVVVGALILCGAVNTSIVGANGVLNRLAEDGIMADWFRWLHPKYGTTHRMINLITALQVVTIVLCRGNIYLLGEAYAFGVIWSFVFKAASVIVLRFKDPSPREYMVPLNVKVGRYQVPVGLSLIFLVLLASALVNLVTKQVATIWGSVFTGAFFAMLKISELSHAGRKKAEDSGNEKLNLRNEADLSGVLKEIDKPNRVLVAVRDPKGLQHLQKVLETLDSDTTDLIVLYSKIEKGLSFGGDMVSMGPDEKILYSQVISMAEKHGKTVVPLLVTSNDPAYAVAQSALAVNASEVVMGESARVSLEAQLERLAMTWGAVQSKAAQAAPVRFRIMGEGKELSVDL